MINTIKSWFDLDAPRPLNKNTDTKAIDDNGKKASESLKAIDSITRDFTNLINGSKAK